MVSVDDPQDRDICIMEHQAWAARLVIASCGAEEGVPSWIYEL